MNFITISQYFNKLHSVLFMLLMAPLLVFLTLYLLNGSPAFRGQEYLVILAAVLVDGLVAVLIFDKKIKSARNEQGLGAKLDKYFVITIVRYSLLSSAGLMLALGFYLSRRELFPALYIVSLVLAGMLWPTARKVCSDLRLKGDEREMVYYKKDVF